MNPSLRRLLAGSVGFLWLIIIIGLYYIYHKPFDPPAFLILLTALGQLIPAFALLALAGGLGGWILPAVEFPALVRLTLQVALGIGVLSLLFLLAGATLGLNRLLLWGELVAGIILLRKPILAWLRLWRSGSVLLLQLSLLERLLAVAAFLILAMSLINSLSPPLAFDALVYHLTLPRLYLQAGRIYYVPQIMFWGMPQTGEMLYTWAMGLAGEQTAALVGWAIGLLTLVGLAGALQAFISRRVAWVAIASLIAAYSLAVSLSWAYIDWLMALFGLCFLLSLLEWRFRRRHQTLFVVGIFTGLAFTTKYTGGMLALIGIGVLGFDHFFKRAVVRAAANNFVAFVQRVLIFGGAAGLVALPWLIKNWLATGNPFYPLIFPGGAMDATRLRLYESIVPWGGWQDAILLPLRATYWGVEGAKGYSASIGPLLLGLGLPAVLGLFFPNLLELESASRESDLAVGSSSAPPPRLLFSTAAWIALGSTGRSPGFVPLICGRSTHPTPTSTRLPGSTPIASWASAGLTRTWGWKTPGRLSVVAWRNTVFMASS